MTPLSWSRISVYRQCPKQYQAKFLTKTYPDDSNNPAFVKGSEIHKQLELYIIRKKEGSGEPALCKEAQNVKPIIDHFFTYVEPDNIFAERQIAVNQDWQQVDWFGANIKYRCIIDMLVVLANKLVVLDFKSGKVRDYDDPLGQLHLTATILFELFPDIDEIECAYLFVEHKQTIKETFTRAQHNATKAKFSVEYLEINADTEYLPVKNKYCYFCGIKQGCQYGS